MNKWIVAKAWVQLIHLQYDIPAGLKFTATDLNRIAVRNYPYKGYDLECTTVPNAIGVYKARKKTGKSDSKKKTAYLYTKPLALPLAPGGNSRWYDSCVSLSSASIDTRQQDEDKNGSDVPDDLVPTTPSAQSRKKRRGKTILRNGASGQFLTATADP